MTDRHPNIDTYVRDGRLAAKSFNQTNDSGGYLESNQPLLSFQYYVKIRFNSSLKTFVSGFLQGNDESMIIPLINKVELPTVSIETTKHNQYNKFRITQKKLKFAPMKLTLRDVADGKTYRLWEMYYKYYFKDGDKINGKEKDDREFGYDVVSGSINTDFGYNIGQVQNEKYLIDAIEIYQVHAGHYKKTILVNPAITSFAPGSLSYDKIGDLIDINLTIDYEDVLYHSQYEPFTEENTEVFSGSDFRESKAPPTVRRLPSTPRNNATVSSGGIDAVSRGGLNTDITTPQPDKRDVGILSTLQRNVSSYVESLPDSIARAASSALFTGKVEFPVDIKSAGKSILTNTIRQSKGDTRRVFTSAVRDIGKSVLGSFNTNGVKTTSPNNELGERRVDSFGTVYYVDTNKQVDANGVTYRYIDTDRTSTNKPVDNLAPVSTAKPL